MKTLNEEINKMKRLFNFKKGDVLNEQTVSQEHNDIIGASVMFKPKSVIEVYDPKTGDEWTPNEMSDLGQEDKELYDIIISKPIKGDIISVEYIDDKVKLEMELIGFSSMYKFKFSKSEKVFYECGSGIFNSIMHCSSGDFLNGKNIRMEYTSDGLSKLLEERLPCGGFTFSKSDKESSSDGNISS